MAQQPRTDDEAFATKRQDWYDTLSKGRLLRPLEGKDYELAIWLYSQQIQAHAHEVVILLAMLRKVDPAAWKMRVSEMWGSNVRYPRRYEDLPNVGLGIEIGRVRDVSMIVNPATPNGLFIGEEPFLDFKQEVLNRVALLREYPTRTMAIQTPFYFDLHGDESEDLTQSLEIIHECMDSENLLSIWGDLPRDNVDIEPVAYELSFSDGPGLYLNMDGLKWVKRLLERGVRLGHLISIEIDPARATKRQVLEASTEILPRAASRQGTVYLDLDEERDDDTVRAVLSAIRHCTCASTLQVFSANDDDVVCPDVWRWVAYALCCDGATHTVNKLRLFEKVSPKDLDDIEEVLSAKNSLALIVDGDADADPIGQVMSTKFFLEDPTTSTEPTTHWARFEATLADVIAKADENEGWWQVLLPGYGCAWVHCDDVVEFQPATALKKPSAFSTISICFEPRPVKLCRPLAQLLSKHATRIEVD